MGINSNLVTRTVPQQASPISVGVGDGSDGAVTATTGTIAKPGVNATTYYVGNGVTVAADGWAIRAQTSITVDTGGIVHCDGGAASEIGRAHV